MSAATNFRHITDRGGESFDRPALASILAGTKWYRAHNDVLRASADTVTYAMRGNAEVSGLVDVAFTGTGAGIVGAFGSATAVPFVRLLGLANGDVDNSASVADVDVDNVNDYPYTVRRGVLGLEIAAAMSLPGPKFVTDNQTITENYAALLLPIHCDEIDDGLGYCLFE